MPVRALSVIFRAKFRDCMKQAGLAGQIGAAVWRDRAVHSQAAGDGRTSLTHLAPYVLRVAIGDRRIISCDEQQVTFSYRKSGSRHYRAMTLPPHEFIRRLLQNVLPRGFQKVRHYGFLSPNGHWLIEAVPWMVTLFFGQSFARQSQSLLVIAPLPPRRRAECGGLLVSLGFMPPLKIAYFDSS